MQTAQLEVAILERPTAHRIDTVMDGLLLRYPPLASYSAAQLERTREDVAHILRHAAAALVVDDPTLFVDFTEWMLRVLASRDVAPAVIRAGYQAIREVCGEELPNAALLLESAENLLP